MNIDITKITDAHIAGIDTKDYPDFCDAYLDSAAYEGREMTEDELIYVTENHPEYINEKVFNQLY